MIDRANIDFIDGYLSALSHLCHGTNYVPLYGAYEVQLGLLSVEKALNNHLGVATNNLTKRTENAKTLVSYLLEKWVRERLFGGNLKTKGVSTRHHVYEMRSCLLDRIEDIVSTEHSIYKFGIEHDDFGYETEALCFLGNERCIFIYFGWWD